MSKLFDDPDWNEERLWNIPKKPRLNKSCLVDRPKDKNGRYYNHCIDFGHKGTFWCHIIIDQQDWKVWQND
jgi:hypothetical protein